MNLETRAKLTGLHYHYTARDWKVFFISNPPLVILYNYLAFGKEYFLSLPAFVITTLTTLLLCLVIHFVLMHIGFFWRRQFPAINQSAKRYALSVISYTITSAGIVGLYMWIYNWYNIFGFQFTLSFFYAIMIITLVINVIIGSIYEFFYSMQKWKESIEEKEQFQKLQLQQELNILKSQVNPHFLFNSLNTLASLITGDPEQAEDFVQQMSKVYRYLLHNNEAELTSLETEIKFNRAYFHLLQTRYGQGISMYIEIPAKWNEWLIPPLTLQLLVENAVKHNAHSKQEPLHIQISANEDEQLLVRNNLQRKNVMVDSGKVGLKNITNKYKVLKQPDIVIMEADGHFTVCLPLMAPELNKVTV
jgi:sensor histidine kinase YesM